MRIFRTAVIVGAVVGVAACSTPLTTREKGAVVGGAVGAGAGAAIGSASGNAGTGALIGAGVGAVSGALIGDAMQANEQRQAAPQPPPPAPLPPPPPPPVAVAPPPPPVAVASPPPVVVPAPQYIWVPQWGVYVVEGYDIAFHEGYYYYLYGNRWYVSRSYGGPWKAVAGRPAVLVRVPPGQFHRKLPPGLAKQGKVPPGHMR